MMDGSEESAWVFDSLIGFLHGPIWNCPLQTFIEEKSLIFEPTDDGNITDRKEYLAIFEEYKNMVDLMLGSYMEDIGITPEQFERACQMSKDNVGGLPSHFHRRLFEQIWAANDYTVFTRMMTQRNVELQLQALELIEQRSGVVPNSYVPYDEKSNEMENNEDTVLEQVKQLSLEEVDNDLVENDAILDEGLYKEKLYLKSALDYFKKDVLLKDTELPEKLSDQAGETSVEKISRQSQQFVQPKPLKEDIVKRQEYLKQQRDKLLTLKRQIREKQLETSENESIPTTRPKSAKTAKLVLSGEPIEKPKTQDSSLQLRKALAERLRSEVVEKS